MMGPWAISGSLLLGARLVLYEGAPDFPGPDRIWALAARHGVTHLGLSPTVVRALIPHGTEPVRSHDLGSLRVLGSTGEPWDPESWWWYFREVGGGRCPVVNYSGGTEVSRRHRRLQPPPPDPARIVQRPVPRDGGGRRRAGRSAAPRRGRRARHPAAAAGPDARLLERSGSLPRDVLEPACPGSGSTATGRSSTPTATGTSAAARTTRSRSPASASARRRSRPRRRPTRRSWRRPRSGFRTRSRARRSSSSARCGPGETDDDDLRAAIGRRVVEDLGKTLRPEAIVVVPALPKTRSGKIMRRVIRAAYLGTRPGRPVGARRSDRRSRRSAGPALTAVS